MIQLLQSVGGNLSVANTLTLRRRDHAGATTLLIESNQELQSWRRNIRDTVLVSHVQKRVGVLHTQRCYLLLMLRHEALPLVASPSIGTRGRLRGSFQ